MGYVLDQNGAAYVESSTSQSSIGTATTLVAIIRVEGALLLEATAVDGDTRMLFEIGGGGTTDSRFRVEFQRSTTNLRIFNNPGADLTDGSIIDYPYASIVSGDYYLIYAMVTDASPWHRIELFTAAGSSLAGSDGTYSIGNNPNSANGRVRIGSIWNTVGGWLGAAGKIDGWAVYSTTGIRTAPTPTDANILAYSPFDEGSGTTTANLVAGGQDLDTFSGTISWVSAGSWDGPADLVQEGFRWRNDDGDEDAATWAAAQDVDVTAPAAANRRLRVLLDATDDPAPATYQLEYKLSSDSIYRKIPPAQPSVGFSILTQGSSTSNVQTFATASVTLTAGKLYIVAICHSDAASEQEATGVATTGGAEAFTLLDSQVFDTVATNVHRLSVWRCVPSATVTATITATLADAGTGCAWFVVEVSNSILTGTDGADAIGTPVKSGVNAATSVAVTPAALANTRSLQLAFCAHDLNNTGDVASGTNWSSSHTGVAYATPNTTLEMAANTSGTASQVTFSTAGTADRAVIAFELKAYTEAFLLAVSSHITASGEATTAQLTAPAGKSTSDFDAGRIQDDENPADSVDITADDYTELEWCIQAQTGQVSDTQVYDFRVTAAGAALSSYDVTPQWTIGTGSISLVVADATHGHAVDSPALTQANVLAVQDARSLHAVDSPALVQANTLAVQDASHAHSADAPTLTQGWLLAVADASHAHAADSPALSQANVLAPADALHGHTAEAPTLTQANALAVQDASHAHAADSPPLTQGYVLGVQDATHGHAAETPSLVQANVLAPVDALHAHAAESPALVQAGQLAVQEALHGQAVDSPTLTQAYVLAVADALHGHGAESPTLTLPGDLSVHDSAHAHAAESPALVQANQLAVQEALHQHTADSPTLAVGATLQVAEALHGQSAESPTLGVAFLLEVAESLHGHFADAPVLTTANVLAVFDALHAHRADTISWSPIVDLQVIEFEVSIARRLELTVTLAQAIEEEVPIARRLELSTSI